MYRKSLEMSEQQTSPATHPKIVDRVAQLPVVTSASEVASHYYTKAKETHPVVKTTLETAEKVVKYAAETAKPVVEKLEKPISVVDDLACKTLDKVEEKFPVITRTPEEIAKDTREMVQPAIDRYNSAYQYGVDKVNAAKGYSMQKADEAMQTPYGQAAASAMSKALNKADQYVEYYLPGEVEEKLKVSEEDPMADKFSKVSTKLKNRVHKLTLNQVENLQKRTQETLAHLHSVLEMAQNARNNTNQALQERYNNAQQKAIALWEDLNKGPLPEEEAGKTVEQRSLALARYLTQSLVSFYNKSSESLSSLPHLQPTVAQMQQYANDLFTQVTKITKVDEVTNTVMNQVRDKTKAIQDTVSSLAENAMKVPEWMVSHVRPQVDAATADAESTAQSAAQTVAS